MTPGEKIESICRRWAGTPYVLGQRWRGVGADCANFVVAVLDEAYGYPPETIDRLDIAPGSSADRSEQNIRAMLARYKHERISSDWSLIEPGDIVFVRSDLHIGHVLISGNHRARLWHATHGIGVCATGIGPFLGLLERIYRPLDKALWIKTDKTARTE